MQAVESNVFLGAGFWGRRSPWARGRRSARRCRFPMHASRPRQGQLRIAVHDELNRQIKAGVRALRGPRAGEAARALARRCGCWRRTIRRRGSMRVSRRPFRRHSNVRAGTPCCSTTGARCSTPRHASSAAEKLPREPFNLAARARALEAMQQRGASPALLDAAGALERLAPQLDRSSIALARGASVRVPGPDGTVVFPRVRGPGLVSVESDRLRRVPGRVLGPEGLESIWRAADEVTMKTENDGRAQSDWHPRPSSRSSSGWDGTTR